MTAKQELLDWIANRRSEIGKQVQAAPENWKICVGCQSLIAASNVICSFCHSYGFETDRDEVVAMAILLGNRRIAWECAILPRSAQGGVIKA